MSEARPDGFEMFAIASTTGSRVDYKIPDKDRGRGLFTVVADGKVTYIGRFENGIKSRLGVMKTPGSKPYGRLTELILDSLQLGKVVEILVKELPKASRQELEVQVKASKKHLAPAWNLK